MKTTLFRFLGFAMVISWAWYFYYRDELMVAQGMVVTASWLAFREARQIIHERATRPGRRSSRALGFDSYSDPYIEE
ncbi:MAG: hypothetical protein HY236_10195 [Acidobacteria bacterium]|nr:hypothetical protein [Acidobacteriota bacterium]